jgi:hypothetical protein
MAAGITCRTLSLFRDPGPVCFSLLSSLSCEFGADLDGKRLYRGGACSDGYLDARNIVSGRL